MDDQSPINFDMGGQGSQDFIGSTLDQRSWPEELRGSVRELRQFIANVSDESNDFTRLLHHPIDGGDGRGLGDSRLFAEAVFRAAKTVARAYEARTADRDPETGAKRLKFDMPITASERQAFIQSARAALNRELMLAKAEWIKRTGRPLPGGL
jgi:hypothetical protein